MAKVKVLDSAKALENQAKELFERIKQTQADLNESLQSVRRAESKLQEKEDIARKERIERERAERLRELLDSDEDLAFHVGEQDEPEPDAIVAQPEQTQPAAEAEAPAESAAQAPAVAAEKTAQASPAEPPAQAAPPRVVEPISAQAPVAPVERQNASPAYGQGRPAYSAQDRPQRQENRPYQPRQQGDRPYQPRQEGDRPYQPRQQGDRPYQPRQEGDRPYQPRQQGDRPYQPRQQGDRPYQPRQQGDRPYQPRQDQRDTRPRPTEGRSPAAGAAPARPRPPRAQASGFEPQPQARTAGTSKAPSRNAKGGGIAEERKVKSKKSLLKETAPSPMSGWEDETHTRRRQRKQQAPVRRPEPIKIEKAVLTTETITVKDLSEKIGKPAAEIIKKLFMLGIMATINQELDFDTCELIASEYGIELELQLTKTFEDVLAESSEEADAEEMLVPRPPVVTIMGHVDHGKTSLLDAIRQSSVTEGEAGGITQHIGAYTVTCNGRQITFIDTPGHEAFTSMRARGAQVTDIVILVVAADDGIMPQTAEAISHAKAAGVPLIVAINKMDRPTADAERVKQQLTEYGLLCEEWGGDTICVPVSAKTRMGLDSLLEMVLLQADVLELRANPDRIARGTIIEAELHKGRGPIATVLVQNGTLRIGDPIVAGTAYGRIRAMMDDKGNRVTEAGPSTPVEVLGFSEVPSAGDILNVAEVDKLSRHVAEERRDRLKAEQLKNLSKVSLDDLFSQIAEGEIKDLNIIVKADVQGSVEAVRQALEKLSNDEVRVRCIHGGVGAINGSDVMFASASNAIIIGFNVRPDAVARESAAREKVDMRMYRVIYGAIEDIENAMKGMFAPVFKEVELGRISVRDVFKVSGVGTIAGAYVQDGKVQRNAQVRLVRDGIVIHEGKISSLKRFKDDVREVATGYECGIGLENYNDIQQGDIIEAFIMEKVER